MEALTLYRSKYFLMRETKQPTYLDFFDIEDKDLKYLYDYEDQTVRYNGKWFFIEQHHQDFSSEERRDASPKAYIKYLYKKTNHPLTGERR